MKEIMIEIVVEVPNEITEDILWHSFIEWIEKNGWRCGGGINEIKT